MLDEKQTGSDIDLFRFTGFAEDGTHPWGIRRVLDGPTRA